MAVRRNEDGGPDGGAGAAAATAASLTCAEAGVFVPTAIGAEPALFGDAIMPITFAFPLTAEYAQRDAFLDRKELVRGLKLPPDVFKDMSLC